MDDALLVRRFQPFDYLQCDPESLVDRDRTAVDALGQGLAFGHLHDQQLLAVDVLETVDPGDPRVVEACQQTRLAFEAREALRVGGEGLWKHLDGDLASELGVFGLPHLTHPALAELF